jgi:hypothetical protein
LEIEKVKGRISLMLGWGGCHSHTFELPRIAKMEGKISEKEGATRD